MVGQARQKPKRTPMGQLERWTLFSGILIWTGVLAFSAGLVITLRNQRAERLAYASLALNTPTLTTATIMLTATPPPTQTPQLYPAGWATATPTPSGWSPTRRPVRSEAESDAPRNPQERAADGSGAQADETLTRAAPRLGVTPQPPPPPPEPPDRLVIPEIELDSPIVPIGWSAVVQGGSVIRVWEVADDIVGWHETSGYPGLVGNTVLNGHHNIRGEVFRYLVDLEPGDQVYVYAQDRRYVYAVTEKHILKEKGEPLAVRRENARWIEPTDDERLTMITCWPYTNNTHRLVVVARPVPTPRIEGLTE